MADWMGQSARLLQHARDTYLRSEQRQAAVLALQEALRAPEVQCVSPAVVAQQSAELLQEVASA